MPQIIRSLPRAVKISLIAIVVVALLAVVGGLALLRSAGGATTKASKPVVAATVATSSTGKVFTIESSSSQATFTIKEILFGNPNTVVGTTNQVAGQIRVDQQDPALSQVGQIKVDVSTLVTDNNLRNNIIRNQILETNQSANQYATFVPTTLKGLPTTPLAYGQRITFQIVGQLTLHQVTRPATFATQATLVNATTLTGTAQSTIVYGDYNVSIPSVPSVAGVPNTVVLALTFTAQP